MNTSYRIYGIVASWRHLCRGLLLITAIAAPLFATPALAEEPGIVTASSFHSAQFDATKAMDGDTATRWASGNGNDGEWLQIDLGEAVAVGDIRITWERAFARDYELLLSDDGEEWRSVHHEQAGDGRDDLIPGTGQTGRYVRVLCHTHGRFATFSIWEVAFLNGASAEAAAAHQNRLKRARLEATRTKREALHTALRDSGAQEIVYTTRPPYPDGHWYANIGYYGPDAERKTYVDGGGLYVLDLETEAARPLVEDPTGNLRDPAVHYDGHRIVFSWRKGGTEPFHLYTIGIDGTGLTQLTSTEYDDIEPAWLPDGGIVFVSSRCRRWVNCWLTQVAIIHRCDADGGNVTPLSANIEHDNTPWPLPDGRILYMRWEYVDRSQVDYHHLWTMNPDGTGQMVYFGNMHPPNLYIDAKPIPGTNEILFINSPGHGAREHAGHVAIVTPDRGPDALPSLRNLTDNGYRDPYPLTKDTFLAAHGRGIMLLDRQGTTEGLYAIDDLGRPLELHEPRPVIPHPRERVIPPRVDYAKNTGRLILSDVRTGRKMDGVAPGDIAKLLVVESLPKPINYTGGMDPLSYGGTFTLERILGTVPVEDDGSAYMELPANRSLFFVALDKDDNTVKRMQSFLSVMPGETTSCVGCHESRTRTVQNTGRAQPKALGRAPSPVAPIPGIPEVFDFPRDIQPILDQHCLGCHDYVAHANAKHGPRAGGAILSGDRGPMFSHSYVALTVLGQISDGRDQAVSNYAPRSLGAAASPLMHKVLEGHHGVKLSTREIDSLRYWLETGAAYPGTYGALGGGAIGGYHENQQIETDYNWPVSRSASRLIANRCLNCHVGSKQIPKQLSDESGLSFWRPAWDDKRLHRNRHIVFNLSRPQFSLMLLAPLAKEAGGYGLCLQKNEDGVPSPVFPSTNDPGYQKILALCVAGKEKLEEITRFDMPGFQPPAPYIREMRRYGVLAAGLPANAPVDPYECDRAYWASFDQAVALDHPAYDN